MVAEVEVTVRGPLFEPSAPEVLIEMRDAIARGLLTEGHRRVLAGLDATLRNPSGAYRGRITPYGPVAGQARVHDQRSIYGPWLEGTGRRNRTTRFKGYRTFRKTVASLRQASKPFAAEAIRLKLWKLGG